MSLSRVKVWGNEVLTATDLNAEFNNIINNAVSLISPLSGSLAWNGYAHTLDAAGTTTAQSSTGTGWFFTTGSKSGTPGVTGHVSEWTANTFTDTGTAGSGTATKYVANKFNRPTLVASNALVTTTDAATVYIVNSPFAGANETITNAWSLWIDDGDCRFDGGLTLAGALTASSTISGTPKGAMAPAGLLWGLTLANGTNATTDINIGVGECASDDATVSSRVYMALSSVLVKQLNNAWAVGTNAGGLDTGAIANTTYHVWVIQRPDTGVVDALFSVSATSPTMPANYTKKRRIGSILREAGAIVAFTQDGDYFRRTTSILDINTNNPGTSAVSATLSVPLGLTVHADVSVDVADGGAGTDYILYLSDLASTDSAPSHTVAPLGHIVNSSRANGTGWARIRTNTSAQIRYRINASSAAVTVRMATHGWMDTRGRAN